MHKLILATAIAASAFAYSAAHPAEPASPTVLASGRWAQSAERPNQFQATWPGVSLAANFSGSAVGVVLNDERSYYAVEIDGKAVQQIAPASGKRTIWVKNLTPGEHKVELIRRNETPDYVGTVYGFTLDGTNSKWLAAPATPKRKIEFIGDSFTAALADLSTKRECNDAEISASTDISQGFAIKVARELGAQWQTNAMSGMGLIRNWNGNLPDRDFRTFYARQLQTDAGSKPDFANWQPQLVVIGLGINDFSTQVNAGEKRNAEQRATDFQAAYRQLIKEINGRYKQPHIIVTAMKLWPDDQQRPNVRAVVESERAAGNTRIHYLSLDPMQLTGCQWHPNLEDHNLVASQLKAEINDLKLAW
ncbi:SGNH/GDSL hydrolase family protein [Chitinibacter bivalviorum]|uniref:SGNH/GDSL hydrolase family protein n=1 Tax=Chitinibacter bivalviorum TaxID=2739434 RepID=A0A7H9BHR2_9NEIS|nr:SGNH/GDSL hydrolase family protein [Chitinibacter bivalviorum]QLG88263.1 SGNH/GDSL hydrolase family protein [Chitinibacter bivalviorum]